MRSKPLFLKVQFHHGNRQLFSPDVRAVVIDTLFGIGRSREDAAALWQTATTDPGPQGARARHLIEQATDISITVAPTAVAAVTAVAAIAATPIGRRAALATRFAVYALALTRLVPGLRLFDIKCAWFNEACYNEFFPRLLLPRPAKRSSPKR
jgi:hypothetical protein